VPDLPATTELLLDLSRGDRAAIDRLVPLVYNELRAIAAEQLRHERAGHTLQPTALAHEAYLRLVDQSRVDWKNRAHFLGVAAEMVRRVLVDHARARAAAKRGGGAERATLTDVEGETHGAALDLIEVDTALAELRQLDERQARVVELRFFGGMSVKEITHLLGVSERTVLGDWAVARTWLRRRLEG